MNNDKPPPAPDPTMVANAQTASNKSTAITQQNLNSVDQKTPYGNLTYNQTGTWADGTPKYQATTSLSPEMEGLFNLYTKTQGNLGQAGVNQSAAVSKHPWNSVRFERRRRHAAVGYSAQAARSGLGDA
jgi:hypothetical protein